MMFVYMVRNTMQHLFTSVHTELGLYCQHLKKYPPPCQNHPYHLDLIRLLIQTQGIEYWRATNKY